MRKNRLLWIVLGILAVLFLVGWSNYSKDGHSIGQYDVTYDSITVTSTRTSIPVDCEGLFLKADDWGAGDFVYVGGSTVTTTDNGFELGQGDELSLSFHTVTGYYPANSVYLVSTSSSPITIFYVCLN
jgi:hypothetical protein